MLRRMGIKAAQVIDFLIMHAHPLVKYKDNILPGKYRTVFILIHMVASYSVKMMVLFPTCPIAAFPYNNMAANVTDQLALWENENYRIKANDAVVVECRNAIQGVLLNYKPNNTAINVMPEVFASLVRSLRKVGLLLWESAESMTIAIPPVDNYLRVVQSYIESCVSNVV